MKGKEVKMYTNLSNFHMQNEAQTSASDSHWLKVALVKPRSGVVN